MATSSSLAFVAPPLSARRLRGAAADAAVPPTTKSSSFTPGHGAAAARPTAAAHPSRPRMTASRGAPSAAAVAWAAAALRVAGGVDPSTHHVAAVLRRSRGKVDVAAAAEELPAPESPPAPTAAAVVDVGPSAAVLAWVTAQSRPAAAAASTVVTAAYPAGSGEWARRQASLSRHVAARWTASASRDSPVEEAASRLGSSETYTPPPPTPPSAAPPAEEAEPKTLGEYLSVPVGSSPLESAAAVLARSARLAPTGKAAMEEPPRLAALLDAPPSPDSPLEAMAASLIPPEPEAPPSEPLYPPEAYVDWNKAPPAAATPLEASANMLARAARLDPSGRAAMEVPPPLAELLDAPPADSPLQQIARRLVEDAAHATASAAAAAGDEGSEEAEESAEGAEEAEESAEGAEEASSKPSASSEAFDDPKAALITRPLGDSPLEAAASVLASSAELAPTGKAAMEVPPPVATLLRPPLAASPLTDAAGRLAAHDKVKEAVEVASRRLGVVTTTLLPASPPLSTPDEVKELLTAPPARSPLTMVADQVTSPFPVSVSSTELEGAGRSAASREARSKRSTGAPVVAAPAALPSFITAALTGTAGTATSTGTDEPAAADAAEDGPAPVRDGRRAAVPPAVTLAFVGACLALSQAAGAVVYPGLPLH